MSVFFKALAINIKRFIQYALEKTKEALAPTLGSPSADYFACILKPLGPQKGFWALSAILWLFDPGPNFDSVIWVFTGPSKHGLIPYPPDVN